ncbi:4Fe-4S ferredoxin, iron-sulfur binding protein [Rhodothermus marinus DSM 4252]|uniref:4Fe-4S ferredoxin, iron-sulfur binding protein n=2 Tax=Rhodothermus marinus TaxID=29549 RepID=D0MFX0_RHOM4|nr:4Fe-4S ferredoxin, iron-sulfur binding protein [Rhodothermus marinus DSM 4252]
MRQTMAWVLERRDFDALLEALARRGYTLIGPRVRDGAIVYDRIRRSEDLPVGWTDEQRGGTYRLRRRDDEALFGYVVGPQSWKQWLFPPTLRLWRASRSEGDGAFAVEETPLPDEAYAFIGVRACELAAIAVQDRVFLEGPYADPYYRAVRERLFLLAVNCTEPGGTCFCASMQTGPRATAGFDLALTEVLEGDRHYFVVTVGSDTGRAVLSEVPHREAQPDEVAAADTRLQEAATRMGRHLDTEGLKELLQACYEHPCWDEVARRCLSCANCTMVCPTCFCHTVEDVTDLTGQTTERVRRWDSCFSVEFSYIHGGSVRQSTRSRYRQWLMHKLSTWVDQFGVMGCVGCGRCITWCPVGIDLTEEVAAIRSTRKPASSP